MSIESHDVKELLGDKIRPSFNRYVQGLTHSKAVCDGILP